MHILGAAARFDNPLPQQSVDHPSMVRRAGTGFGNCRTGAAVHTLDPLGHVWISITLMDRAREAWCVVCAQTQTLSQSAVPPSPTPVPPCKLCRWPHRSWHERSQLGGPGQHLPDQSRRTQAADRSQGGWPHTPELDVTAHTQGAPSQGNQHSPSEHCCAFAAVPDVTTTLHAV